MMILDLKQVQAIACGAVKVTEENGWFSFFRETDAQSQAYQEAGKTDFYNKSFASAGVRLAFRTSSERLFLDWRTEPASSRRMALFDLYVNGVLTEHFGKRGEDRSEDSVSLPLGAGEKTVELYLPWSCRTELSRLALDDGASLVPVKRKHTLLQFGDSITHGYDAVYPSLSYASRVARELDADAVNKGIGGDIFFPPLLQKADPIEPEWITVAYGTNDWSRLDAETYAQNCRAFYARLVELYPNARIFAITPIWRADGEKETPFGAPISEARRLIARVVEELPSVTLINGEHLAPHNEEFYSDKYLHPDDLGFSVYAANLCRELKKHLS